MIDPESKHHMTHPIIVMKQNGAAQRRDYLPVAEGVIERELSKLGLE